MWKRLFQFLNPYRPDLSAIKARDEAYAQAFGSLVAIAHSTDHKAPHIDLYIFRPEADRNFTTIISGGMSDLSMTVPEEIDAPPYVELIMHAEEHREWQTTLMKVAAEYPFDNETFLSIHHTTPFGSVLQEGSLISAFLYVSPRSLPEPLEQLTIGGRRIHFLQVVPITTAEHQFAVAEGSDKLEELLEKEGFLIARDDNRPSVVESPESTE